MWLSKVTRAQAAVLWLSHRKSCTVAMLLLSLFHAGTRVFMLISS
jgi:hypothetical protein